MKNIFSGPTEKDLSRGNVSLSERLNLSEASRDRFNCVALHASFRSVSNYTLKHDDLSPDNFNVCVLLARVEAPDFLLTGTRKSTRRGANVTPDYLSLLTAISDKSVQDDLAATPVHAPRANYRFFSSPAAAFARNTDLVA